jgi:hypothetical protein
VNDERRIPPRVDLGKSMASTMAHCVMMRREHDLNPKSLNPHGLRTVMGFCLPTWQRGFVWTEQQNISFIESAWRGVTIGTYTYNQTDSIHPLDNILIDGQQRMRAIQDYMDDKFKVFGWLFSELTTPDMRRWMMAVSFPCFITNTTDEKYLREYYNLMNFGGTAHGPNERATEGDGG